MRSAFRLRDQIPRMYDAFAEACLGRSGVPVPASEGIDDLRMMEAIYRAALERYRERPARRAEHTTSRHEEHEEAVERSA